ncbi:hypothetical protein K9M48_02070 [Candidatus Gracilibacteria bacterium]|nr:hypothetical protein [Candidatus Gracilibacteria bacterium]
MKNFIFILISIACISMFFASSQASYIVNSDVDLNKNQIQNSQEKKELLFERIKNNNQNKINKIQKFQDLANSIITTTDSLGYNTNNLKIYNDQITSLKSNFQYLQNDFLNKGQFPNFEEIKYYNNNLKNVVNSFKNELSTIKNTYKRK